MGNRGFADLSSADVALAGGKGASLGELAQAGFPVPNGFVIPAPDFDRFLDATDLAQEIAAQLDRVNPADVASVDRASRAIQAAILSSGLPGDLERDILGSFAALGAESVAVRSSATAEDSSVASWAGELESFLNTTEATLLENVKKCWASLYSSRAIVYRHDKCLSDTPVSVAVVVQKMVQSEVSGICFTVHPVTKDPNQLIIEACWGLGEMIVGGRVTPDSYVIDKRDGAPIDVNISTQETQLVRGGDGNEEVSVPSEKKAAQKLDEAEIRELAELCAKIEKHYGFPCDIEWGMEQGQFFILQSRPITTL